VTSCSLEIAINSVLARLQQMATIGLLLSAAAWFFAWWPEAPWLATAGAVLIPMGYALVLAAEFIIVRQVNRQDSCPQATWRQLFAAWLAETRVAPLVFCWRQPFRSNEVPDSLECEPGRRGVVLIHGFVCNRGFWTPWLHQLNAQGHAFVAVNLEPVFGSIDDYAPIIDKAVREVTQSTGLSPILVCHSMGGLAARAWLRMSAGDTPVHHIITLGTPHRGTWLGRFSQVVNGKEMYLSSDWLRLLAEYEATRSAVPFTCWYSNCDNIVFPATTATLPGADNQFVEGVAHVQMAFHSVVMEACMAKINAM